MTTELTNVSLEEAITEKTSENGRKRDSDVLQTEEVDLSNVKRIRTSRNQDNRPERQSRLQRSSSLIEQVRGNEDGENDVPNQTRETNSNFDNRVGVIECIHLVNFMCHDSLKINFGPRINFVIGHNGSGKSAILTGLTICLGAKASNTNRAPNMKSLVKQGKNYARISVTISNRGFEAYQPEIYGKSITIERTIRREGSSEYRLRSFNGTVISTKRDELDNICDHMGLQIDNPMNILTQDTARQFLGNSSPKEKYQLFMKGIQLKQLEENYSLIEQSLINTKNVLGNKKTGVSYLAKKEEEYKLLWEQSRETENLHNLLEQKKGEMAWAQVVEVEKELLLAEKEFQHAEVKLSEAKENLESIVTNQSDIDGKISSKEEVIGRAKDETDTTKSKFEDIVKTFDGYRSEMNDVDIQKRDIQNSINAAKSCLDVYREQLNTERARENNLGGSQIEKRANESNNLQREIADLSEQIVELESKRNDLHSALLEMGGNLTSLLTKKDSIANKISDQSEHLKVLEDVQRDKVSAFGKNMPQLLKLITRETRFQHPPKGPMGKYMTVKEQKWHLIIERILGNVINGFIVRSHHDQLILKELMRQSNCHATVVVGKYDPFDYSSGEPDSQYPTVLKIIKFDDDEVLHTLINHLGIEKMLLIEDRREAEAYMKRGIANVTQCYALDPRNRGYGFRIVSTQRSSGISKVTPWNRPPRIGFSSSTSIEAEKKILDDLKKQYNFASNQLNEAKIEQAKFKRDEQLLVEKIEGIKKRILLKRREVNSLESQELSVLDTEKIQTLERRISETEKELESYVGQLQDAKNEEHRIRDNQRPVIEEIRIYREKIQTETQRLSSLQTELSRLRDEKRNSEVDIERHRQTVESCTNILREKEAKKVQCAQVVADYTAKANTRCERVPVQLSPAELDNEIERLQMQIAEWRNRTGVSVEQAAEDYLNAKEKHDQAKVLVARLTQLLQALEETLRRRNEMWTKFRKLITLRTKELFELYLSQRNFTGKLVIKHQEEFLEPRVYPANRNLATAHNRHEKSKVSVQGLSGGEKSFATICMLLSIWEAMSCPLRCLDEFDVFMDAVNRLVSIKMMVDSAKDSSDKQFIFITPQDMGQIGLDKDVVVFRLSDPVVSSSALPPSTAP
ncbi:Smc5-6 complex SMC subunit Smc6 [Schizosaccharomyces pombe]